MARETGKIGQVWCDAGVPTEADVILHVTNWELDYKGDAIDVTGMDSAGAKAFIAGLTEGTVTVECFLDAVTELDADIVPGATLGCYLLYADGDLSGWKGSGILTDMKPSVPVDGGVKWSLTLQYSGTFSYAALL